MSAAPGVDDIIIARCLDPRGFNPKTRPVLVVGVLGGGSLACLGISTSFNKPIPPTQVELAYSAQRKPYTGLRRPSVVICDWEIVVQLPDVVKTIGYVNALQSSAVQAAQLHIAASARGVLAPPKPKKP